MPLSTADSTRTSSARSDSLYRRDSIYIHEYSRGDTVYMDRYRDRIRYRTLHTTDTVYRTLEQVRTLPAERYIPGWVKALAYIGGVALLLLIARVVIRTLRLLRAR